MELKTKPEACSGDSITSGRVVIWILDPSMLETINKSIPIYVSPPPPTPPRPSVNSRKEGDERGVVGIPAIVAGDEVAAS